MDALQPTPVTSVGRRRVAVPVELWPARDREAWLKAQRPGDFLEDHGPAAAWRPATCRSAVGAYGRWIAYLDSAGLLDPGLGPAERMTKANIDGYLVSLRVGCSSMTVASYVAVLSMMIQAMAPGEDWAWLRRVQARLQRRAEPSRDKRGKVVPATDLLELGLDLMAQAEASVTDKPLKAALLYRDGLMIALLAARPLRQRNLLAIVIGRHLVPNGDGYTLRFAANETKTRHALEFAFPVGLLPALRRYLTFHRPYLLGLRETRGQSRQAILPEAGGSLWITQYGTPFGASAHRAALEQHTMARFGHVVNPHLFRDCVASTVANNDPEHVRMCAQLLGHRAFRTTERNYITADRRVAEAGYHDLVLSIRKEAKKPADRGHYAGR